MIHSYPQCLKKLSIIFMFLTEWGKLSYSSNQIVNCFQWDKAPFSNYFTGNSSGICQFSISVKDLCKSRFIHCLQKEGGSYIAGLIHSHIEWGVLLSLIHISEPTRRTPIS